MEKKMNKMQFEKLVYIETNLDFDDFKQIYGTEQTSTHLWNKFKHYDSSLFKLYRACDLINQRLMLRYINKKIYGDEK